MHTLSQYLQTLENPEGLTRRLKGFELLRERDGKPIFHVGNRAIVFKIRYRNQLLRLRCYTQPPRDDAKRIYGERLLEEELYLYKGDEGEWVDVILEPWIEGENLEQEVRLACKEGDRRKLWHLSEAFEELASRLLAEPWAHGDLKPENMIVDQMGRLHLIDFDACFLPSEREGVCFEMGTPAYRHPARGAARDRWLDHYPAALIAVQLRALALDPTLTREAQMDEGTLFQPEEPFRAMKGEDGPGCRMYRRILELFANRGDAVHYRLCKLLTYPTHRLDGVEELLRYHDPLRPLIEAESYFDKGLAGFRNGEYTSPLLYDEAFDFSEGWALVRLGERRHYIDRTLRVVYTLPAGCCAAKSLRDGKARYRLEDTWFEVAVK